MALPAARSLRPSRSWLAVTCAWGAPDSPEVPSGNVLGGSDAIEWTGGGRGGDPWHPGLSRLRSE